MAFQCFRLALTANNDHAESYCNLGVLEMRKGNNEQVHSYELDFAARQLDLLDSSLPSGDLRFPLQIQFDRLSKFFTFSYKNNNEITFE